MMNKSPLFFFLILFVLAGNCRQVSGQEYGLLWYNVENLFDTRNDSLIQDDEFTPSGDRHWTAERLQVKLQNTAKAIAGVSGWKLPAVIGLCEVENGFLLDSLVQEIPLKPASYRIIHKNSPDHRGIDVALLYNSRQFFPLTYRYFPLREEDGSVMDTREILWVKGVIGADTLHLFMNHWPSRYGGLLETRPLRKRAAALLKAKVDSILSVAPSAKIVMMGDFNDQPNDESLSQVLSAKFPAEQPEQYVLYNLSMPWQQSHEGTIKYRAEWMVFDQIIVSGALLFGSKGLVCSPEMASIGKAPFLFEPDERYGGIRLYRTYLGYKYRPGFSDHLPVMLKLSVVR